MSSPNQLSFLPDDYLERKAQRRTNAICAVLFLTVMVGIGSAFALTERTTRDLELQHSHVEQQWAEAAKRIEQVKLMQDKQKRMARQAELSASLLEKVPRSNILAEWNNLRPTGVFLLDFTLESRARKTVAPAAPKNAYEAKKAAAEAKKNQEARKEAPPEPTVYDVYMKLTGIAETDVLVAQYMTKLSRSPLFRDVNLVMTDEFKVAEQKLRKFQIEMMLNGEAPPVPPEAAPKVVNTEAQPLQ